MNLDSATDNRTEQDVATFVERTIRELQSRAAQSESWTLATQQRMATECLAALNGVARPWVEAACRAKRIPAESPVRAEEILAGPVAVARYLRLLICTLRDVQRRGEPELPAKPRRVRNQLRVPIFPTREMYDKLLFYPMTAEAWLDPAVDQQNMFSELPSGSGVINSEQCPLTLVLGAGNVASIPFTDALTKIFQEDTSVLLKMNPVNDYLHKFFESALAPLIKAGRLAIISGDARVGAAAINHGEVDRVHITGSTRTHDTIVWGAGAVQREEARKANGPQLTKPITSELGNVTPWIVVPGDYSRRQLRFQAENIVASIVNNGSFNCIATKMIVTSSNWSQRTQFLEMVEQRLHAVPQRYSYYPGAEDRFRRFAGVDPAKKNVGSDGCLPWTLTTGVTPTQHPYLFQEESFVCVCGETMLDAPTPEQFLSTAVQFVNEQMWGTLAASLTVDDQFQRRNAAKLDQAICNLQYGTIGINQWSAIAFALMSPPWGGLPSSSLQNVQSGIGMVHNTYRLNRPHKTVLRSPLITFPKPVWFPTHRNPAAVAWHLLDQYLEPSILRLPRLLAASLFG